MGLGSFQLIARSGIRCMKAVSLCGSLVTMTCKHNDTPNNYTETGIVKRGTATPSRRIVQFGNGGRVADITESMSSNRR